MRAALAVLAIGGIALASPAAGAAQCYTARDGSPYDFTAASGTLYQTDFSGVALGEFPDGLEFKSGAMEVAEWQGRRTLKASAPSALVIPLATPLPERFSVELGVVNRNTKQVGAETIEVYGGRAPNAGQGHTRVIYGPNRWEVSGGGASAGTQFDSDDADVCMGQETTVRVLVDGPKLKAYADERRLASVPNAKFLRSNGLVITLGGRDDAGNAVYLTSIRVSGGGSAPATTAATPTTTTTAPTVTAVTTTAPAAGTVAAMPATTTTATTTAPIASGTPSKAATVGRIVEPVAPTNVRATVLSHGTVWVRWDSMPGALGYTIVRWLPDGKYVGANPAVRPEHAATDTAGATIQLNHGPATLSVMARYEDNVYSPPSAKVTVDVPRWWGKYRISVLGFRVDRETRDDPAETDGKRDEVFVRAAAAERDADAQLIGNVIERQTFVYGDINYSDWQNASSPNYRIRAGSASALGGLMTGNQVPKEQPWQRGSDVNYDTRLPLLVWEGDLYQGRNHVQVALSIWETDQRPGTNVATFGANSPERAGIDAAAAAARRLEVEHTGAIIAATAVGVLAAPAVLPLLALSAPALAGTAAIAAVAYGASEAADAAVIREITPRVPVVLDASTPLDQLNTAISKSPLVQNPVTAAHDNLHAATQQAIASAISWAAATVNTAFGTVFLSVVEQLGLTLNVKDRPIGLRKQGSILVSAPWILTLSFENIEGQALVGNGPDNLGPGVYAMEFRDDPLTFGDLGGGDGVYTLYVQVQRLY